MPQKHQKASRNLKQPVFAGFTLAELLIALAILGVIATFTIPKVLQSQQNSAWKSEGKEAVAMVSQAFDAYRSVKTLSNTTVSSDLTPYMNYVRVDTVTIIDNVAGANSVDCSWDICLKLHNGGVIYADLNDQFGQLDGNHYIYFIFDPDAKYSGTPGASGKASKSTCTEMEK